MPNYFKPSYIKAKTLHFIHILIVLFQKYHGGVVIVQKVLDLWTLLEKIAIVV